MEDARDGERASTRSRGEESAESVGAPEEEEHLFDETEFEADGWSISRDSDLGRAFLKSLEGLVPEVVRRTVQAGVEGVGASDELKSFLADRKLPKEVVSFLLGQVDLTKREVVRMVSREVRLFLEDADLGGELAKILTSLALELRMEVRFKVNEEAIRPSAKGKIRVKRAGEVEQPRGKGEAEEEGEAEEAMSSAQRWSLKRRRRQGRESRDPDDGN